MKVLDPKYLISQIWLFGNLIGHGWWKFKYLSKILSLGFLKKFQVAAQLGIATWIWGLCFDQKRVWIPPPPTREHSSLLAFKIT
jgi:hypothetical protein